MTYYDVDEIYPVTRITAGAVGDPGRRIFVLQAQVGEGHYSWMVEKSQVVALGRNLARLLDNVRAEYPELGEPLVAAQPRLELSEPLDLQFRVGAIRVAYDRMHDLVMLTLVDADAAFSDPEELDEVYSDETDAPAEAYLFTTRGQALLLSQRTETVVAAGRPTCPACGQPIDDFGHFCSRHRSWARFTGRVLQ